MSQTGVPTGPYPSPSMSRSPTPSKSSISPSAWPAAPSASHRRTRSTTSARHAQSRSQEFVPYDARLVTPTHAPTYSLWNQTPTSLPPRSPTIQDRNLNHPPSSSASSSTLPPTLTERQGPIPPLGTSVQHSYESGRATALSSSNPGSQAAKPTRRSREHVQSACSNCKRAHLACQPERPCQRCVSTGKANTCVDVEHKKRGRPRIRDDRLADAARRLRRDAPVEAALPSIGRTPLTQPSREGRRLAPSLDTRDQTHVQPRNIAPVNTPDISRRIHDSLVAFLDMDLTIVRINSVFENMFGARKLKGVNIHNLTPGSEYTNSLRNVRTSLRLEQEARNPTYLPPIRNPGSTGTDSIPAVEGSDLSTITQGHSERRETLHVYIPLYDQNFALNATFKLARTDVYFVVLVLPTPGMPTQPLVNHNAYLPKSLPGPSNPYMLSESPNILPASREISNGPSAFQSIRSIAMSLPAPTAPSTLAYDSSVHNQHEGQYPYYYNPAQLPSTNTRTSPYETLPSPSALPGRSLPPLPQTNYQYSQDVRGRSYNPLQQYDLYQPPPVIPPSKHQQQALQHETEPSSPTRGRRGRAGTIRTRQQVSPSASSQEAEEDARKKRRINVRELVR